MHTKSIYAAGKSLEEADKVLIMVHGRGGTASDILSLAAHLKVHDFALLAPQATNHTWYPYSFLAPVANNEPWLSSAIQLLDETASMAQQAGIASHSIYWLGFSQGACLTLEYVARHARRYGGVAAFTGGLIGAFIDPANYKGHFDNTPIFIGTSDPDPHVPVARVNESAVLLKQMNAQVSKHIYPGMGHTITGEEIAAADALLFTQV